MILARTNMKEIPESCTECAYYQLKERKGFFDNPNWCTIYENRINNVNFRPDWCPLVEAVKDEETNTTDTEYKST